MRLLDYIRRERLSYEEIAGHLSCTKTTVYRIAKRIHFPKTELARMICEYTNGEVSLEDLYSERPKKPLCPCCGHKLGKKLEKMMSDTNELPT